MQIVPLFLVKGGVDVQGVIDLLVVILYLFALQELALFGYMEVGGVRMGGREEYRLGI